MLSLNRDLIIGPVYTTALKISESTFWITLSLSHSPWQWVSNYSSPNNDSLLLDPRTKAFKDLKKEVEKAVGQFVENFHSKYPIKPNNLLSAGRQSFFGSSALLRIRRGQSAQLWEGRRGPFGIFPSLWPHRRKQRCPWDNRSVEGMPNHWIAPSSWTKHRFLSGESR